jgi:hypothetical protein
MLIGLDVLLHVTCNNFPQVESSYLSTARLQSTNDPVLSPWIVISTKRLKCPSYDLDFPSPFESHCPKACATCDTKRSQYSARLPKSRWPFSTKNGNEAKALLRGYISIDLTSLFPCGVSQWYQLRR